MFLKILNVISINTRLNFKYKFIIFFLKEILFMFKEIYKSKSKKNKYITNINLIKILNDDYLLFKQFQKKLNKEINIYIHILKEDFLNSLIFNQNFFEKEWFILYRRNITLHKIWLIYINNTINIDGQSFYIRQKKLYKLFNRPAKSLFKYKNENKKFYNNIYWGIISIWNALKIWIFSIVILFISFYILLLKRTSVLPQTLFFWIGLTMLLYWILSGFVFFVKKYQFSRFTSVIQRFWRRSYILFWLIEGGLLLVFFYLMINSSQESFYMFDQGYFFKTHLFSWKLFVFKCILIVTLITYSYLFLLNLKWSSYNKSILNLVILTILLLYLVWTEFYQIYWVSNFYANFSWFYDIEELTWTLEFDGRRTRILNHYVMILFLLKFWHIIFIFGCWLFFLLRSNELENITYSLYSFNFQNFIILFLMMWLFMYPWFKHTFHWLAEIPYYWFYVDVHTNFYKIFVYELYYFYYNNIINIINFDVNIKFNYSQFINWFFMDNISDFNTFIKSTIKNEILQQLIQNK